MERLFSMVQQLGKSEFDDIDEFERSVKSWVKKFTSLYQTKDVTPYIHAFAMHVPQFLRLHGNISSFTQQGLEKLNDLTTKSYQRSSNHHDFESLKQVLQKHNRLELLEYQGFQRVKQSQNALCASPLVTINVAVQMLLKITPTLIINHKHNV